MAQAYTKTLWVEDVTQTSPANLNNMESGIYLASAPLVSSLPGSPVDGQEINYIADATAGVIWHLVYRSASGKWHYTGGPPLYAQVTTFSNIDQAAYFNWSGPAITVPLLGDYSVTLGFRPYRFGAGKDTAFMSFQVGAAAAVDADAVLSSHDQDTGTSAVREIIKTAVPAATSLSSRWRNGAGVWAPANAWMRIQPIRLG